MPYLTYSVGFVKGIIATKDAPVGVFEYVGITQYLSDVFPKAVNVANRDQLKAHVRVEAERDAMHGIRILIR
jgi:hypothetical protein